MWKRWRAPTIYCLFRITNASLETHMNQAQKQPKEVTLHVTGGR